LLSIDRRHAVLTWASEVFYPQKLTLLWLVDFVTRTCCCTNYSELTL